MLPNTIKSHNYECQIDLKISFTYKYNNETNHERYFVV